MPAPGSREALDRALAWLAAHQDEDGRWDADGFMRHDPDGDRCSGAGVDKGDVGVTGLALLAPQSAGPAGGSDEHRAVVARGAEAPRVGSRRVRLRHVLPGSTARGR
ncbi:MAG: hypothetical protein AB1726_15365 [Planctomycetota bacterium]